MHRRRKKTHWQHLLKVKYYLITRTWDKIRTGRNLWPNAWKTVQQKLNVCRLLHPANWYVVHSFVPGRMGRISTRVYDYLGRTHVNMSCRHESNQAIKHKSTHTHAELNGHHLFRPCTYNFIHKILQMLHYGYFSLIEWAEFLGNE